MAIPTAKEFRKQTGRVGISSIAKKKDPQLDIIFNALLAAEPYRDAGTMGEHDALRAVRAACVTWISMNQPPKKRASRTLVQMLCQDADGRIGQLAERLFVSLNRSRAGAMQRALGAVMLGVRRRGVVGKNLDVGNSRRAASSESNVAHYGQEALLSGHRTKSKVHVERMYTRWLALPTQLDFEVWLGRVAIPCGEDDPMGQVLPIALASGQASMIKKDGGVAYLDAEQRRDYAVTVSGGVLKDCEDSPFHTGAMETAFSKQGWAIYVMAPDNTLYSNSHVVGEFHHSSFLSGGPVQAAGEWAVDQGRLRAITPKTGHYKAGAAELVRVLFFMSHGGVDLGTVKACVEPRPEGATYYNAREVLLAGADVSALQPVEPPARVQE